MSLCDTEVKNQVRALEEYREFNKKLDSMTLLREVKKIEYTGGSDNLHVRHNKAMAHIGFMDLRQEKHQDIQDFRDQYMSIKKVCDELRLTFGRCESDAMQDFIKYMERNMIPNCPVTKADIIRAEDIFGANIGALQGKTVRKKLARVVTTIHELPMEIIEHHRSVTLEADIMYINEIPPHQDLYISIQQN